MWASLAGRTMARGRSQLSVGRRTSEKDLCNLAQPDALEQEQLYSQGAENDGLREANLRPGDDRRQHDHNHQQKVHVPLDSRPFQMEREQDPLHQEGHPKKSLQNQHKSILTFIVSRCIPCQQHVCQVLSLIAESPEPIMF